ncbi:MAG TPA: hypothetical protein VI299_10050, partial [Polyangiales bacterium]
MNEKVAGAAPIDRDLRYHRHPMLRFVWLMVLCWVCLAPLCLHAEPPSEYDAALDAALDAHERGDLTSARMSMERAHALLPSARTLRGLAIIAHAQGRHVETVV